MVAFKKIILLFTSFTFLASCSSAPTTPSEEEHTHNWGIATYTWSVDYSSCTANRVCLDDSTHIETEMVYSTYEVITSPTCEEEGLGRYTARFTKTAFATQTHDKALNPTGHDWDTPTYVWSDDNSSCTATITCKNDSAHIVEETQNSTYEVITSPTCEEEGLGRYTVSFTKESFTNQQIDVSIEAHGHDWGTPTYIWADDHSSCTATITCLTDSTHTETETAESTYTIISEPTYEADGLGEYTASFTNTLFSTQTFVETIDMLIKEPTLDKLSFTLQNDDTYLVSKNNNLDIIEGEIVIPSEYQGKAVTTIGDFHGIDATNYIFPKTITTVNGSFDSNKKLVSIKFPDSITSFSCSFSSCHLLENVDIPDSVTKLSSTTYMFNYCNNLKHVSIPFLISNFSTCFYENTTQPTYYDSNYFKVTSYINNYNRRIYVASPKSFNSLRIGKGEISEYGFKVPLEYVTFGAGVTVIEKKVLNEISAKELLVEEGNTNYSSLDSVIYNNKNEIISFAKQSEGTLHLKNGVKDIPNNAFSNNHYSEIILNEGLLTIGENAFSSSVNLEEITIPNSVLSIGEQCFQHSNKLTSVTLSNKLTTIPYETFLYCENLQAVTFHNSVTSILESAFSATSEELIITFYGTILDWRHIRFDRHVFRKTPISSEDLNPTIIIMSEDDIQSFHKDDGEIKPFILRSAEKIFDEYDESLDEQLIFDAFYMKIGNDEDSTYVIERVTRDNYGTSYYYNYGLFFDLYRTDTKKYPLERATEMSKAIDGKTLSEIKADATLSNYFSLYIEWMNNNFGKTYDINNLPLKIFITYSEN